jgi:hypothetical protein
MKGPKIISLDYGHDFVPKQFVWFHTSTPSFKSSFTQFLSHIVHQTKLLNIFKKLFQIWAKIQLMISQIKNVKHVSFHGQRTLHMA